MYENIKKEEKQETILRDKRRENGIPKTNPLCQQISLNKISTYNIEIISNTDYQSIYFVISEIKLSFFY